MSNPDLTVTGYQDGTNARGTLDILWTCLTVLFLCSYTAVHPNIPHGETNRVPGSAFGNYLAQCLFSVNRLPRSHPLNLFLTALVTFVGPEIVITGALFEVHYACTAIWKCRGKNNDSWVVRLFADGEVERIPEWREDKSEEDIERLVTFEMAFYALAGGLMVPAGSVGEEGGEDVENSPEQMLVPAMAEPGRLLRFKRIELWQYIMFLRQTPPELRQRNCIAPETLSTWGQADSIAKGLTLFQALWFGICTIARPIQGLAVSPLELMTASHVIMTAFIYVLWWKKPYAVQHVTLLWDFEISRACEETSGRNYDRVTNVFLSKLDIVFERSLRHPVLKDGLLHYIYWPFKECAILLYQLARFVCVLTAWLFETKSRTFKTLSLTLLYLLLNATSGIHLVAWNWDFPNAKAREAWRAFSLILLVFLPFSFILVFMPFQGIPQIYNKIGIATAVNMYAVGAKVGLLALALYSFVALPASTYQDVDWQGFLPSIS